MGIRSRPNKKQRLLQAMLRSQRNQTALTETKQDIKPEPTPPNKVH